jgi:hypothetical protein
MEIAGMLSQLPADVAVEEHVRTVRPRGGR